MAGPDRSAPDALTPGEAAPEAPSPDAAQARLRQARERLEQALAQAPYRFDFFQALRRLECVHRDQPRIGASRHPADDPVRLAQQPSTGFAPSTLASFEGREAGLPPRLAVYFLGLLGPNGPLPLHLTEYVLERLHAGDPTLACFLDIFHHRMLSLFYRAWAEAQPTVSFDRFFSPDPASGRLVGDPQADRFAAHLGALFGMDMPAFWNRDAVPDLARLHYAGRLACQTRNAEGLRAILADFFKLPVAIEEFIGHWLPLAEADRCRLGQSRATGLLGVNAVLGERVWDCQSKFRIVIGPLGFSDYQRMLPGAESLKRLVAWVRSYLGDELIWEVNLILKKEEVPALRLDSSARLGWTTWLTAQALPGDADDLKLNALAYVDTQG